MLQSELFYAIKRFSAKVGLAYKKSLLYALVRKGEKPLSEQFQASKVNRIARFGKRMALSSRSLQWLVSIPREINALASSKVALGFIWLGALQRYVRNSFAVSLLCETKRNAAKAPGKAFSVFMLSAILVNIGVLVIRERFDPLGIESITKIVLAVIFFLWLKNNVNWKTLLKKRAC